MVNISVLYAATQCICELGFYVRAINGKCTGEVKHIDTPGLGLDCVEIFHDLGDSFQLQTCTQEGINVTIFADDGCGKPLFSQYLPTGHCHPVEISNHTLAVMAKCGEE
eukprot:CAMPEP_0202690482 /NCGR_PEP_ID=MMETSP1385-20130828/5447_1 /ASSEMBLY_ACC=CAM_ASM_000861 /TAXON_ID=933848 /ORGANISM="Elphidium margaritaceum" /LENGTH=108 /DNA_ID=CAMNT_0049345747 /DNA_START=72 /DNA_END=398 /DNA_ORIENTATION=-